MRKVTKKHYWKTGLLEFVMNFNLARPIAAVSKSRDFQQMNNGEVARKRFEIRKKLQ